MSRSNHSGVKNRLHYPLFVVLCCLVAVTRIIQHVKHSELFLSPDSASYLSLAGAIWSGHGYQLFGRDWCSVWPPFYPFLLGLVRRIVHHPGPACGVLNAVCFATIIAASAAWFTRLTQSRLIAGAAVVFVTFATPLNVVANAGLTETLYIAISMVAIYCVELYRSTGRMAHLVATTIAVALGPLTKYDGLSLLALIPCSQILLLAPRPPISPQPPIMGEKDVKRHEMTVAARIRRVVMATTAAMAPIGFWLALNKEKTGYAGGLRGLRQQTVPQNLHNLLHTMSGWFAIKPLAILGLLLVAIAVPPVLQSRGRIAVEAVAAVIGYIVAFLAILLYSAMTADIGAVDSRLVCPIFVPVVGVLVAAAELVRLSLSTSPSPSSRGGLTTSPNPSSRGGLTTSPNPSSRGGLTCTIIVAGFFLACAGFSVRQPDHMVGGYLDRDWQTSKLAALLASRSLDGPLYSNDVDACYYFAGKQGTWLGEEAPNMGELIAEVSDVPRGACIAWFHVGGAEPGDYDQTRLVKDAHLKVVAAFDDGAMFRKE